MPQQVRLTQDSLIEFLASTKLPLVSRLVSVLCCLSGALAIASGAYALVALAFFADGFWNPELPLSGAMPSLVATPLYVMAWTAARRPRLLAAALALFAALFLVVLTASLPRGLFYTGWYAVPVLAFLATCGLGIVPGFSMTTIAVAALLATAWWRVTGDSGSAVPDAAWMHAASLGALTLALALAGAIVHHLLLAALLATESQRRETVDSHRALRYRERLLRHAMRIETVGDLAGLVSHQLRNAFQVMLGHVALGNLADDSERARRLQLVGEALEGSRPLLDELMGLAHPEEGQPAPADLGRAVGSFVDRARLIMPASIQLVLERNYSEPLPVHIDVRGLDHALWNLVINARQAMPEGGQITVRTGAEGEDVWVAVVDTGPGIPSEIRDRIFDPYFTTKPPGQGTGLGLAAVARFVRANGGRVEVDSEMNRGTTFLLIFPLASGMDVSAAG